MSYQFAKTSTMECNVNYGISSNYTYGNHGQVCFFLLSVYGQRRRNMLKHSSQPVTLRRGRRPSDYALDMTVFHFDGIQVPPKYMPAFKRIHLKSILQLKGEHHKAVYALSPSASLSQSTPFAFYTKSTWTLEEFNNSSLGKTIIRKCVGPIKKIQLGIFDINTKVIWTDEYRSVGDMTGTEKEIPEQIICFLKRSNARVSLDYVGHQANNLIDQMKLVAKGKLQGFCVYKNLFTRYQEALYQDYIIEFFIWPNTGHKYLQELADFSSMMSDVNILYGLFHHRDVVEKV